jgi:hypothetical protein
MKSLAGWGFTTVIHTMSEFDLEFYSPGTMKDIVSCSRDAGLKVLLDPWGLGNTFGGEAYSARTSKHPEAWQVDSTGKKIPALCFSHKAFGSLVDEWLDTALSLGADGIFWDEPHFRSSSNDASSPSYPDAPSWSCRCKTCRNRFFEKYGKSMPNTETSEVAEFRTEIVAGFPAPFLERAHSAGKTNTVCLLPFEDFRGGVSNWENITSLKGVDTIASDPYWHAFGMKKKDILPVVTKRLKQLADTRQLEPQVWFQAFRLPAGAESEIIAGIEETLANGIGNIAFWGFEACAHMDGLSCEFPGEVWSAITDLLKNFNGS